MNLLRRRFLAGAAALSASPRFPRARNYPARPVRMIVPFGPAGNADVLARIRAERLSEQTGQRFYVEDIGGAGGNFGMARAALAAGRWRNNLHRIGAARSAVGSIADLPQNWDCLRGLSCLYPRRA